MKKLRIYIDTSVFGGCFDEEFADESNALLEEIRTGKFILVISETLLRELDQVPEKVQKLLASLPPEQTERVEYSDKIAKTLAIKNGTIKRTHATIIEAAAPVAAKSSS